jgi:DNA-3-methyladenine glycosylase
VPPLTPAFFARPCLEVAPDLLGCQLIRRLPDGTRIEGRIVEVEAYLGDGSDAASHTWRGQTPRNAVMFGPPGRLYVYRSMGLHSLMNVVCEPEGIGAAVLLRAVEPLAGLEAMRAHRGHRPERELCSGPGKLTQAFAIGLEQNGRSSLRSDLRVALPREREPIDLLCGPRIGLSRAVDLPYRFFVAGSPWITRSPQNRRARPWRGRASRRR